MDTIESISEGFDKAGNAYPPAAGIACSHETIAAVDCYWYGQPPNTDEQFLVYVHGGGFFLGSNRSHGAWTSHLAQQTKQPVLLIDYSLAPEHRFPTALHQVLNVLHDVHVKHPHAKFGLVGDSAGGNIALAAAVSLKEKKFEQPSFNVLISPWLDLECKSAAFERNKAIDKDLTKEGLQECVRRYVQGKPLSDPMVSPLNANFVGLAPVMVACGTNEILEDDSLILCERLKAEGVPATFIQFKGEGHSWSFYNADSEASKKLFKAITAFIEQHAAIR